MQTMKPVEYKFFSIFKDKQFKKLRKKLKELEDKIKKLTSQITQ